MPDATAEKQKDASKPAVPSASKADGKAEGDAGSGKMRAWHGCTYDDYRDHAMRDYPLPSRMALGFVVGARDITPAGTHWKRLFWRVFLKVGDPITFDELDVKGRKAKVAAMEKLAMERVYALRDELRAEHPGKN